MSVNTTADIKIREAKHYLSHAYTCLHEVLDEECWGYEDLADDYIDKIHKLSLEVLKLKRKL